MPSIQITASTINTQTGQPATLFNPFAPYLGLNVEYTLSADLISRADLPIGIIREMIDLRTNEVIFYQLNEYVHTAGASGQVFWYNINPSNTPGMDWVKGDIFGFRAAGEVTGKAGAIDATMVTEIQWFRLQDIFDL